jgi:aspartate kinase
MIIQVVSDDTTTTDITFTVPATEYERAMNLLKQARRRSATPSCMGRKMW